MTSTRNLVLRSPDDVVAYVPTALGFHPERSVVLLAMGERPFQARVDLTADLLEHLPSVLVSPVIRHAVRRVVLVYYSSDERLIARAHRTLTFALRRAQVRLMDAIEVAGGQYRQLGSSAWRTCDLEVHPLLVEALVDGRAPLRSRAELADTLRRDPELVDAVSAALQRRRALPVRSAQWAVSLLEKAPPLSAEEIADVLRALREIPTRDAVWEAHVAARATDHVALWRHVTSGAPDGYVVAPAALLSFAAWLSGDGALAWCAYEIAERADPGYRMSRLMAELLSQAVPPGTWRAGRAS